MSWNNLRIGRFSQAQGEYLVTFNTQDKSPFFNDFELGCLFCRQIAINQYRYQCTWLTWVLMPDHFHGLLRLNCAQSQLSATIAALKGDSTHVINKHLKRTGKVWQPAFHDRALRAEENRVSIARYIAGYPLRKKLVSDLKDYPFWNAIYL